MPKAGERVAYRPRPRDFDEKFVELGWTETKAYFRARQSTVSRWVDEEGREELLQRRALRMKRRRTKAVNYVMGRRLSRCLTELEDKPKDPE